VRPTTPTFLSEVEEVPPTKPVVYSPVPIMQTFGGAIVKELSVVSVGKVEGIVSWCCYGTSEVRLGSYSNRRRAQTMEELSSNADSYVG
jgi:hypothetical protein